MEYDEKLVLGAGRRDIVVYDLANYDEIASAIRAANEEFGLDFLVRKIQREGAFHRARIASAELHLPSSL